MRNLKPFRTYTKIYKSSGITVTFLPVRTKTGKEIHLARGASCLCGTKLMVSPEHRYVDHEYTCERCKEIYEKDN